MPVCRDGQEFPGMEIVTVEDAEVYLRDQMAVMTRDFGEEIKKHNDEIIAVVRALGGSVGKYRRERQKGIRAIVAEVYSPPRVTVAAKLLPELKLTPGSRVTSRPMMSTDASGISTRKRCATER